MLVEEDHFHRIMFQEQHAGHSQGVAAVVSGTGKDNHAAGFVPTPADGVSNQAGRFFHQVDG